MVQFQKMKGTMEEKKNTNIRKQILSVRLTTNHKTVNIVNEVNFKIVIDERIRKYCRGGGKNILVCITKQARIINKYLKRKA